MLSPCSSVLPRYKHDSNGHTSAPCRTQADASEEPLPLPGAVRLYRPTGIIHSICRLCLATIATGSTDEALVTAEAKHVCTPVDLAHSGLLPRDALPASAFHLPRK